MESTQPTQQGKPYKVLTIVISIFVAMGMAFNVFLFAVIASQTFMTSAVNAQAALPHQNEAVQQNPGQTTQQETNGTVQQKPKPVITNNEIHPHALTVLNYEKTGTDVVIK